MKKLTTKLVFKFGEQEEIPEMNVEVNMKTRKKPKHIIIQQSTKSKKQADASTKLF